MAGGIYKQLETDVWETKWEHKTTNNNEWQQWSFATNRDCLHQDLFMAQAANLLYQGPWVAERSSSLTNWLNADAEVRICGGSQPLAWVSRH